MNAINLEYSLGNFNNFFDFNKLFEKIRKSVEKEQKDLLFHKRKRAEEKGFFDAMRFFFTSPDTV